MVEIRVSLRGGCRFAARVWVVLSLACGGLFGSYVEPAVAAAGSVAAHAPSAIAPSPLIMNGDATRTADGIRLAPARSWQSGSVFTQEALKLDNGRSFSTSFSFKFGGAGGIGTADGLAFVLQPKTSSALSEGGSLGFGGIADSLGIEFDTFRNSESGYSDPNANHVGVDLNGDLRSVATASLPFSMAVAPMVYAWVDYVGSLQRLEVRVSNTPQRPLSPTLDYVVNLATACGPRLYAGFTAATGDGYQNHDLVSWEFSADPVVSAPGNWTTSKPILVLIAGINSDTGETASTKGYGPPWSYLCDSQTELKYTLGVERIMVVPTSSTGQQTGLRQAVIDSHGSLDFNVARLTEWLEQHARELEGHPVILVGHSYGGVIARSLLVSGALDESDPRIRAQIAGVIQLASPNGGSELAEVANMATFGLQTDLRTDLLARLLNLSPGNGTTQQLDRLRMDQWNRQHPSAVGVPIVRLGGAYLPDAQSVYPYGSSQWGESLWDTASRNSTSIALGALYLVFQARPTDGAVSVTSLHDGNGVLEAARDLGSGWEVVRPLLAHNTGVPGVIGAGILPGTLAEVVPQGPNDAFMTDFVRAVAALSYGRSSAGQGAHIAGGLSVQSGEGTRTSSATELPARSAKVLAGETRRFTFALDASSVALVSSAAGTATVVVRGPSGLVVGCPTTSIRTGDTVMTALRIAVSAPGRYTLDVTLRSGATGDVVLSGVTSGGAQLALRPAAYAYAGTPTTLTAGFLSTGGVPLRGATITGVARLAGQPETSLVFSDDGAMGDLVSGDGIYTARLTPPVAGRWCATVEAYGSVAERAGSLVFDVGDQVAVVTGSLAETTTTGPGSAYASFGVAVPVQVSAAGTYTASATLSDGSGAVVGMVRRTARMAAGESTTLVAAIAASELSAVSSGRFVVGPIRIDRETAGSNIQAGSSPGMTTVRSYTRSDFYTFAVSLSGPAANPSRSHSVHFDGTAVNAASTVASVDYSLDGGLSWQPARPADGSYNSHTEGFAIDLILPDYVYGLLVRETGSDGVVLPVFDWAGRRFTVDTVAPSRVASLTAAVVTVTGPAVAHASWVSSDPSSATASPERYSVTLDGANVGTTYGTALDVALPDAFRHVIAVVPWDGAGNQGPAASVTVGVNPRATVYTPHAPSTMYRNRHYTIYGYVKPKHSTGTYLVQLNFYLKNSHGVYVYHSHVHARRFYYSSTMTKYMASVSLPHKGKWRVRAYHSDAGHAPSYSGYDYITVK